MTLSALLATVFIDAACDLCCQPKLTYLDPETGGRVCLDCLERIFEPLPELPPDPAIVEMGREIIAERNARLHLFGSSAMTAENSFKKP